MVLVFFFYKVLIKSLFMRQSRRATNLSLSFAAAKVVINQKIIYLFTNFLKVCL